MIIGKNTLTGSPASASGSTNKLLYGTGQQAVLSANQRLIGAYIGWGGKSANPTGSPEGEIGLYDVSGSNYTTAPKIFSVAYSFSNTLLLGAQWVFIPLNVDMSAHTGKTLAPAIALPFDGSAFDVLIESVSGATRKNGNDTQNTLESTLAGGGESSDQAWSLYFETEDLSPAVSITSINGGSAITAGQTGIPVVASGFTAKPTSVTATYASGAKSIAATIGAGTATNFVIDIQDRIEAEDWPANGDTFTFTFTYLSESDSTTQTIVKKSTETNLTLSSVILDDPKTIGFHLAADGFTPEGGQIDYVPYGDFAFTANGDGSATNAGTVSSWFRPSTGTGAGNVYYYEWVISEAGDVVDGGGLTSAGFTATGFTARGLTVTGL